MTIEELQEHYPMETADMPMSELQFIDFEMQCNGGDIAKAIEAMNKIKEDLD